MLNSCEKTIFFSFRKGFKYVSYKLNTRPTAKTLITPYVIKINGIIYFIGFNDWFKYVFFFNIRLCWAFKNCIELIFVHEYEAVDFKMYTI